MQRPFGALGLLCLFGGCATIEEPVASNPAHSLRYQVTENEPPRRPTGSAPSITAASAILIEAGTGRVLYEKNPDVRRPVASTQKLLTALVAAEAVPVTGGFRPVETPRYIVDDGPRSAGDLYGSLLIESANDAAVELAERAASSRSAFVSAMNRKARSLGATSSSFVDPHGISSNQFSTARDMARIGLCAWREPGIRRLMSTRNHTVSYVNGVKQAWSDDYAAAQAWPMYDGFKSGYTSAAGQCLVSVGRVRGREVILVQLGSHASTIYSDGERVMRWASRSPSPLYAAN